MVANLKKNVFTKTLRSIRDNGIVANVFTKTCIKLLIHKSLLHFVKILKLEVVVTVCTIHLCTIYMYMDKVFCTS